MVRHIGATSQDLGVVQELLRDRWKALAAGSPNLGAAAPQANLLVIDGPSEQSTQRLLDELISIASRPPGVGGTSALPMADRHAVQSA